METSHALHLSNLLQTATEDRVASLFEIPLSDVRICVRAGQPSYAYVNFHSKDAASRAKELHSYSKISEISNELIVTDCDYEVANQRTRTNFFVKNLNANITSSMLHTLCSKIGKVHSARVLVEDNHSRCSGFIQFSDVESAQNFFENTDSIVKSVRKDLSGVKELEVRHYVPPALRVLTFTNIYVKNLPADVNIDEFQQLISDCGTVTCINDKSKPDIFISVHQFADGSSLASACANFSSNDEAQKAINKLNKREYKGRTLEAARHLTKAQRAAVASRERDSRSFELRSKFPNCNLLVHNLPIGTTNEDLKAVFGAFGVIERSGVDEDNRGWILYNTYEAGNEAIEASQSFKDINGRPLTAPLSVIRVLRSYHQSAVPNAFPEVGNNFSFSTTWRSIDAHDYAAATDEKRREFRGNAIYEDIDHIVREMSLPENLKHRIDEIVSRVTGMIISAEWSAELAEFISFAENRDEVKQQVESAINILNE